MERAIATAAYEHDDDDDAVPSRLPNAIERGEVSGKNFDISDFETITSMTAEKSKPRLSPQNIYHNLVKDIHRAWPSVLRMCMTISLIAHL
jgi:hypothetical protein